MMTHSLTKILLTGAKGQLASAIINHPDAKNFELIALSREQLDIVDSKKLAEMIVSVKPDIVINAAAYTAVDKAEEEYRTALKINYEGALNLASACNDNDIPLIHISTDYVFDGNSQIAYNETSPTNPVNAYGSSKLQGEQAIQQTLDKHIILRVSGVFSEYGNNFLKTMLKLISEKEHLNVVSDQYTCPTYAGDIAAAIFKIVKKPIHFGIFHYCSKEELSWYTFCCQIIDYASQKGISLAIKTAHPIPATEYKTAAIRPRQSSLSCNKIQSTYQIDRPDIQQGIKKAIDALVKGEGNRE